MVNKITSGSVTQKGQVTIPVEIRRHLGIEPGDRINFIKKDNKAEIEIEVIKATTVEDVYGIFSTNKPLDFENERLLAQEQISKKHQKEIEGEPKNE
ncbi:AbrB family transcriptional regulator [Bacillus sp. V3-13]|uniref:AbrB/MazE/SpoVT family DNA-binding domain-containing protein n=1 Tax=Bacillus sp. V3-13 TaxID=2053728 RepID=UPI000C7585F1|nr:AbrB/MazE/SpoVT family DNA-binding domain-containing protein [Bacillus sp. V3-13]PLR79470.1 AbrB family transcriptional regulator [Bacillus sp. V3-13]